MKNLPFILIFLIGFMSAQKIDFVPLNDVKSLENQYYSKSINIKNGNEQAHLLRLFNIYDDISDANRVEIKIISQNTIQILYGNNLYKNFDFKKDKKFIEITFQNENKGVPIIFYRSDIDKLRLGLTPEHNLLAQKFTEKSGGILIFGDGFGGASDFVFTNFDKYSGAKPILKNGKWGAEINGKLIVPNEYDNFSVFKVNYFRVKKDSKWGILDYEGKSVVPIAYDDIFGLDQTQGDIFYVKNSDKIGLVNAKGVEIVPPNYDRITRFNDDYFEIFKNEKSGLANAEKVLFPAVYTYMGFFSRGKNWKRYLDEGNKYITAKRDGKDVILDSEGYEYDVNRKIPTFDMNQDIHPLLETRRKVSEN